MLDKIDRGLEARRSDLRCPIGILARRDEARILGIFTGQGAQWASMGAGLIRSSTHARDCIRRLDHSLSTLPVSEDRPNWSIETELATADSASNIDAPHMSQSLTTAIQIVLVDMLKVAGVRFSAVVGHSSGEIAAAYAAGFLSASDAIRVAYYMGVHVERAAEAGGEKGGMLAVGLSFQHARVFCSHPLFKGCLWAAAENSSTSTTLAGNASAISKAQQILGAKKIFHRLLHVDVAYHSGHMLSCSDAFVESLRKLDIKVLHPPENSPVWHSTAIPGTVVDASHRLGDMYWSDNIVKPVIFAPALKDALKDGITAVLELGPHPALKTPSKRRTKSIV